MKLDDRLKIATEKLDKLKALQRLKQNAARHREIIKSRKSRDHRIYVLGGMVEKMGLDQIPEKLLLGALAFLNRNIYISGFSAKAEKDGQQFLEDGKKLARPSLENNNQKQEIQK